MAEKTWLPKLVKLMTGLCKYILRWQTEMLRIVPPNAKPAMDAVVEACNVLIGIVEPFIPPEN